MTIMERCRYCGDPMPPDAFRPGYCEPCEDEGRVTDPLRGAASAVLDSALTITEDDALVSLDLLDRLGGALRSPSATDCVRESLPEGGGPDFCATCSEAISEWVAWDGHTEREARLIAQLGPLVQAGIDAAHSCGWQLVT